MKHVFTAVAIALLMSANSGATAFAATDTECNALWLKADINADGALTVDESERYSAMMRVGEKTMPSDGIMSEAAFKENCMAGVFDMAAVEEGAPLEGANSFTEDQARDRVIAAGLTAPSVLTKDDKGIWRGTATQDGKTMTVSVDFKGNVVAQ